VLTAVPWNLALTTYSRLAYRKHKNLYSPVTPSPDSVR